MGGRERERERKREEEGELDSRGKVPSMVCLYDVSVEGKLV